MRLMQYLAFNSSGSCYFSSSGSCDFNFCVSCCASECSDDHVYGGMRAGMCNGDDSACPKVLSIGFLVRLWSPEVNATYANLFPDIVDFLASKTANGTNTTALAQQFALHDSREGLTQVRSVLQGFLNNVTVPGYTNATTSVRVFRKANDTILVRPVGNLVTVTRLKQADADSAASRLQVQLLEVQAAATVRLPGHDAQRLDCLHHMAQIVRMDLHQPSK